MGFEVSQEKVLEIPKTTKFTTIYIKKSLKKELEELKLHNDTIQDALQRLVDRRNFDIVNNEIITEEKMNGKGKDIEM